MKKLKNMLFSMELTGMLLILFAVAAGVATFIENDFGTITAKAKVYNAKWFEFLLLLLAINMVGSIFKNKMFVKRKWTILLFHVSFLVIFVGAAVTRYIGYEGIMSIREGKTSNEVRSDETYIRVWANGEGSEAYSEDKVQATYLDVKGEKTSLDLGDKEIEVEVLEYYLSAGETMVEAEGGVSVIWLVFSGNGSGRSNLYLSDGEIKKFGGYEFGFNIKPTGLGIHFTNVDDQLHMVPTDSLKYMNMAANITTMLAPDSAHQLLPMSLYSLGNSSFVLKQYFKSAKKQLVSTEGQDGMSTMDAFVAKVTVGNESGEVNVFGGKGFLSKNAQIEIGGVTVAINYGAKPIKLPFAIRLDDFMLERYPGSNSPSSYASDITVIDESKDFVMPYKIYMNNVLNYGGYRFFQSSYDRDEGGTVLSVNHDALGTIITYIGYLIMTIGMFLTIFNKNSRFKALIRLSTKLRESRKESLLVLLMAGLLFAGTNSVFAGPDDGGQNIPLIKNEHAKAFGKLIVQDRDGRLKPINTVSSEVLRKLARKNTYDGLTSDQVFLGIMVYPQIWQDEKIIKVAHDQLSEFLGSGKLATFNQIVDMKSSGAYKLSEYVELAYAKKPSMQSKFDKEVMKVDERINVFYMVYSGAFLEVFPIPGDENHKWVTSAKSKEFTGEEESMFVSGIFQMYFDEVRKAVETGDWTGADEHLGYIKTFQKRFGAEIYPSDSKINLEITYNELNIFKRLSMYYGLIGFILIVLHFINILKPKINLRLVIRISSVFVILLFLLHTAGLAIRWSISGHAPWSNGYESLIYIGWATILSGLIFVWRSEITLAVTALLASLILAVAGMSWMDPEITNLVPVLKSYWLIIHVAIITASYGFLALAAMLGFFNLILMNLKSKKNFERLNLTITELSYIIEMTMVVGLFMLTIGTFLGGVWANESWGRYWGWDPKETWALVTVLVYSFIVHMRFIPGFKGNFAFSFAALISYGAVLMTYFGVNYYLSGLHSYAAGDPVPVPTFVYYTLIVVFVVGIMAWIADRKYKVIVK